MSKLIVNCETGDVVEKDLTKAEKDQQKIDEAEANAQAEISAQKAAQRQAIANRLGLTADELQLLLG